MNKTKKFFDIPEYNGPGVYAIKNEGNGMIYIGSSIHIKDRLKSHHASFITGNCNCKIWDDIQNGATFTVEVLKVFSEGVDERTLRREEWMVLETIPLNVRYNHPSHKPYPMLKAGFFKYTDEPTYKNRHVFEGRSNPYIKIKFPEELSAAIRDAASFAGQSSQQYILQAVRDRMERDKEKPEV